MNVSIESDVQACNFQLVKLPLQTSDKKYEKLQIKFTQLSLWPDTEQCAGDVMSSSEDFNEERSHVDS